MNEIAPNRAETAREQFEWRYSHGVKLSLPLATAKRLAVKMLRGPALPMARNAFYYYLRYRIRNVRLAAPVAEKLHFTVQAGPFNGMIYPEEMVRADIQSPFLPKLLGCYEMECNSFIEEICAQPYDQVINIGASEGYYAVGLAMRMPSVNVITFESHAESRRLCHELARLNKAEGRIELRGLCDTQSLADCLKEKDGERKRSIILCDCEGGELDLLQPQVVRSLEHADLLVELHDLVDPDISRMIMARFASTHRLQTVSSCERDLDAYPALNGLRVEERAFLLSEHRSCKMEWLFATAREAVDPAEPDRIYSGVIPA